MGAFPESELGVGGAVNDTSLELGGSLGIAVLGSLLATSYSDHLADAAGGSRLPAATLATAQDSVGAGYAVAQGMGEKARALAGQAARATDPQQAAQLKEQATQLAQGARQMGVAVGSSFSDAVARTSLIGAVVLGVGTVLVGVLLPRHDRPGTDADTTDGTDGTGATAGADTTTAGPAADADAAEGTASDAAADAKAGPADPARDGAEGAVSGSR
jgi:hypothetical protein